MNAYSRIIYSGECIISYRPKEDDSLRRTSTTSRHQLHAHHLAITDHDVAEHLLNERISITTRIIVIIEDVLAQPHRLWDR